MKQKLLWIFFALATAAHGAPFDAGVPYPPELKPERQEAQAAHLTAELLGRYHYKWFFLVTPCQASPAVTTRRSGLAGGR